MQACIQGLRLHHIVCIAFFAMLSTNTLCYAQQPARPFKPTPSMLWCCCWVENGDCFFHFHDRMVQTYVAPSADTPAVVNNMSMVCRFAHTQSEWWVSSPRGYPMLQSVGGTPLGASPGWARSSHTPSSSASLTCWRVFPLPRHWL